MKKIKLTLASLFLLLLGIAFSCKIDIESLDTENNNLLKRARISVDERLKNDPVLRKYNVVPMWEKAITHSNSIELPFSMGGKYYRPFMKDNIESLGRARLLVVEQGKEFKFMIIHYMPSKSFKGDVLTIDSKNFKNKKFDGIVSIYVLGQDRITILNLSNGKIAKQTKGTILGVQKKGRVMSCDQQYTEPWVTIEWDGHENVYVYHDGSWKEVCQDDPEPNHPPTNPEPNNDPCQIDPALCGNNGGGTDGNGGGYDKEDDTIVSPKCDGANLAYNNSFNSDGSVYKESHGFWLANGSLLIYPQSGNSSNSSNFFPGNGDIFYYVGPNGDPKVVYKDGFGVTHTEVVQATFHTHPNPGYCGPSTADINSAVNQQLNIPDIIIGSDNVSYKSTFSNGQYTGFTTSSGKFSYFGCN